MAVFLGTSGLAPAEKPDMVMTPVPLTGRCGDKAAAPAGDLVQRLNVKAWHARPSGGAAMPAARAPVLFFNAAWDGVVENNSKQIVALVQRGYVVIGVNQRAYGQFVDFSGDEAFKRSKALVDRQAGEFARDNSAVLDILRAASVCKADGEVASLLQRLDFSRIGIIGYSFGGAVAAETSRQDPRFKAAVNLDGWLFGDVGVMGLERPFLEISDDSPLPTPADLASSDTGQRLTAELTDGDVTRLLANMARYGGYFLVMQGARHQSFVDSTARSFLGRMTSLLPGARRTDIAVNNYVGAFFDQYVAGIPSDLAQRIASPDDGVRIVFAKPPLSEPSR